MVGVAASKKTFVLAYTMELNTNLEIKSKWTAIAGKISFKTTFFYLLPHGNCLFFFFKPYFSHISNDACLIALCGIK